MHLLALIDYFLFHVGEIFNYNLFKSFLISFLFPFFFWDPFYLNLGVFDIDPKVPEIILSSFHSFYFILLFRVISTILTSSSLILSYASDILQFIPSRVFLIVLFASVCLFFNYSRSLLIDSCIFSILLSRFFYISSLLSLFWIIFLGSYLNFCVSILLFHLCSLSLPFHYLFLFFNLLCLRSPFSRLQGWILSSLWFLPSKFGPVVCINFL